MHVHAHAQISVAHASGAMSTHASGAANAQDARSDAHVIGATNISDDAHASGATNTHNPCGEAHASGATNICDICGNAHMSWATMPAMLARAHCPTIHAARWPIGRGRGPQFGDPCYIV